MRCLETVVQAEVIFVCYRWSNTGYPIQHVCYKALDIRTENKYIWTNFCSISKQFWWPWFQCCCWIDNESQHRNRLSYTKGGWKGRCMICQPHLPPSSKCKNQIVSFYRLPLKSGTLDPPLALVLLIAACSGLFLETTFAPRHVWDVWPSVPLVYSAIWDKQ